MNMNKDNKENKGFNEKHKEESKDQTKGDEETNSSKEDKMEFDLERIFFNRKKMTFRNLLKSIFK